MSYSDSGKDPLAESYEHGTKTLHSINVSD